MKWTKCIITAAALAFTCLIAFSLIFPEKLYRFSVDHQRKISGLVLKKIQSGDHNISYLEGGEGPVTIALIHGFGGNKDNWIYLTEHLPGYHFVIPDLPGFGDSTKLDTSKYDVNSQAERLDRFFISTGLKKFYIAGNSMGGNISGIYASKYPRKIKGLILLNNSGIKFPVKSPVMKTLDTGVNPLIVSGRDDFNRYLGIVFVRAPWIPLPVKWHIADMALASREFNSKVFHDINAMPSLIEDHFAAITMPVLIIWGDSDRILDVSGVTVLEKGIKNHRTHILKDCGHAPMIERPVETAWYIKKFIETGR